MKSAPPGTKTVRVDLGDRAYEVLIGRNLLGEIPELFKRHRVTAPLALISDPHLPASLSSSLETVLGIPVEGIADAGERIKSMENVARLLSGLAQRKLPRVGTIVALGGGVIGDLAGFVAASYLRGVSFVQIPTTLLAMVDSSVGGKTGVNLPEGKNLVGAFHQPKLVLADLNTLETLPPREFSAGMAEIIKYGAIADLALFERVAQGVQPGDADLGQIIARCVEIKARIVENDEFETKGQRALLNFGHTLGHAIEKATGYTEYLHGEAVALGMRAAAWLSHWDNGLALAHVHALEQALVANGLPVHLGEPDDSLALLLTDSILKALGHDKKVGGDGKNRWVLLRQMGKAEAGFEVGLSEVEAALNVLLTPVSPKTAAE